MKFSKLTPHAAASHVSYQNECLNDFCYKCCTKIEFCTCKDDLEQKIIETKDELEELLDEYKVLTGNNYRGER